MLHRQYIRVYTCISNGIHLYLTNGVHLLACYKEYTLVSHKCYTPMPHKWYTLPCMLQRVYTCIHKWYTLTCMLQRLYTRISPTVYKGVFKSSRTVLVKRSLLTLDIKFLHHLQSTPLLHEYSGPSVSAMLGSIPGSPFLELCQVPAAISLESLQRCRIFDPSSEASAWGRVKSHRGPDRVSMGDEGPL